MPGSGPDIAFIRTNRDLLVSIKASEMIEGTLGRAPQSRTLTNDVLIRLVVAATASDSKAPVVSLHGEGLIPIQLVTSRRKLRP